MELTSRPPKKVAFSLALRLAAAALTATLVLGPRGGSQEVPTGRLTSHPLYAGELEGEQSSRATNLGQLATVRLGGFSPAAILLCAPPKLPDSHPESFGFRTAGGGEKPRGSPHPLTKEHRPVIEDYGLRGGVADGD